MEIQVKPTLIITTFFLTILIPSGLVHPRNLAGFPSSAEQVNDKPIDMEKDLFKPGSKNPRRGSLPAHCQSKCNQCMPCMPVEVTVRVEEREENEYYPQVWRCMCHDIMFSP